MRTSLEGTQASGAGESHTQEANVAEVSYGEDGYGRTQGSSLIMKSPGGACERFGVMARLTRQGKADKQVTNGVRGSQSYGGYLFPIGP